MSGIPVMLHGGTIRALIVGGGRVAARKARSLLDAGAEVHVVAIHPGESLNTLQAVSPRLTVDRRPFTEHDLDTVNLVIAATDDRATNARVAMLARSANRLVSVADAPSEGNFIAMAAHRAGDLTIGVSAGGVPGAAARIRDAIATRYDRRYARAIHALRVKRRRLLDTGKRSEWSSAMTELVDEHFCARVESGAFRTETDA